MNRADRRAAKRAGKRLQKKEWTKLIDVTEDAYFKNGVMQPMLDRSKYPKKVYQNSKYIVQVFPDQEVLGKPATKLMIRRNDEKPVAAWYDLQRIKNELFGDDDGVISLISYEVVDPYNPLEYKVSIFKLDQQTNTYNLGSTFMYSGE